MLTQVYPAGVQRGTTTEVTVHGSQNFAGVYIRELDTGDLLTSR